MPRQAASQAASQSKPRSAVHTKALRHPNASATQAVSGGRQDRAEGRAAVGDADGERALAAGIHSTAPFVTAGKQAPSPTPRKKRAAPRPSAPAAIACMPLAADQISTEMAKPEAGSDRIHETSAEREHHRVAEDEGEDYARIVRVSHLEFSRDSGSQDAEHLTIQEAQRRGRE